MPLAIQLAALDLALADVNRHAKALTALAAALAKAGASGNLVALGRGFEQAPRLLEQVSASIAAAQAGFSYDAAAEFASGAYIAELLAAAEQAGVVLVARDGRLSAFPLLLKLEPGTPAVRVGKKSERGIRPSALAALLKQRQAAQTFRPGVVLEQIFSAYAALAPGVQTGWRANQKMPGPVVPLLDIHELLTVLPEAGAAYPRDAFAVDLLRLNRAPDTRTKAGHGFSLSASTATKGRNFLRVYDETGAESVFAGISFSV